MNVVNKSSRQKTLIGIISSDKMNKSRVVTIVDREKHPLYKKYVPKRKKIMIHDGENISVSGDKVLIGESSPYSKCKSWILLSVLEKYCD